MSGPPRLIRPRTEADTGFIIHSWLRSYRDGCAMADQMPHYYGMHHDPVERAVATEPILVACNPDDHDQIFGWWCGTGDQCHFVYVKRRYRRWGMALELHRAAGPGHQGPVHVSFWTSAADALRAAGHNLQYKPDPFWQRYGRGR